jgi:hypothetical protein
MHAYIHTYILHVYTHTYALQFVRTRAHTAQLEPTHDKWTEWQNRYLNPKL